MTGTPISNTIAEVYTLQRYLQFEELQRKGIEYFNAWASTFGQITNGWELDATGVNYKLKSRFASFQNVPELLSMYRSFADVVTKSDLDEQAAKAGMRPLTPPVDGGKPFNHVVERSVGQAAYMERIIKRMEHLPKDPRIDNPLKITNDARKAGLDYRLIDPEVGDYDGSKSNAAVERIFQIWQDTAVDKGTQLVFCDLSTPKGGAGVSAPAPVPGLEFVEEDFGVDASSEDLAVSPDQDDSAPDVDSNEAGDDNGADKFSVGVYYYATKQTYDARMWQTIEYKAAAIEQFRKGDLLQRVIDDVQSEAANAADMKAAASGNPLILMQVKLASDLRKLEALYSQHQRSQHRLRDRLKWLGSAIERLATTESEYTDNIRRRDTYTQTYTEKGTQKTKVVLIIKGHQSMKRTLKKLKRRYATV